MVGGGVCRESGEILSLTWTLYDKGGGARVDQQVPDKPDSPCLLTVQSLKDCDNEIPGRGRFLLIGILVFPILIARIIL